MSLPQAAQLDEQVEMQPVAKFKTIKIESASCKTPSQGKLPAVDLESEGDSSDDFMPPRNTRSGKVYPSPLKNKQVKKKQVPAPRRKDPALHSRNITTTKRPAKRAMKWSGPVEKHNPGQFPHVDSARLLRQFVISDYAKRKHHE